MSLVNPRILRNQDNIPGDPHWGHTQRNFNLELGLRLRGKLSYATVPFPLLPAEVVCPMWQCREGAVNKHGFLERLSG